MDSSTPWGGMILLVEAHEQKDTSWESRVKYKDNEARLSIKKNCSTLDTISAPFDQPEQHIRIPSLLFSQHHQPHFSLWIGQSQKYDE